MKMIKYLIPAVALMFGLASCDNMDELYKDYTTDISIYSTKISGLSVQPGYQRATLKWNKPEDAVARGIEVSWNDGADVVVMDSLASTYEVTGLDGLTYTFVVKSIDAYENRSLPVSVSAKVYGEADKAIVTTPKFSIVETSKNTHALNIRDLSGAMNMWGGILELTVTGAGIEPISIEANKSFNHLEKKNSGYYSRLIETTLDLGVNLPTGEYTVAYKVNNFLTSFKQKQSGVFYYTAICNDPLESTGEATVSATQIVVPEPETPAE